MSSTKPAAPTAHPSAGNSVGIGAGISERRVREQARDVVVLMAFSGALSVAVTVVALLLTRLGQ